MSNNFPFYTLQSMQEGLVNLGSMYFLPLLLLVAKVKCMVGYRAVPGLHKSCLKWTVGASLAVCVSGSGRVLRRDASTDKSAYGGVEVVDMCKGLNFTRHKNKDEETTTSRYNRA